MDTCQWDNEHHLLVINRTGSGEIFHLPVDETHSYLLKGKPTVEEWDATSRVSDFGVAVCDGCLYIIGGFNKIDKKYLSRVMCFDPRYSVWTEKKSLLAPRAKFSTAIFEDKIYVAGGEKGPGKYTASTESYNPATNEWTKSGMLPEGRLYHDMSPVLSYLCTSGGINMGQVNDNIWLYERHNWTNLDDDYPQTLQWPTYKHSMLTIDDRVYFIGGIQEKEDDRGNKYQVASTSVQSFRPVVPVTEETDLKDDNKDDIPEEEEGSTYGLQEDLICPWERHPSLPRLKHGRHSSGAVVLGSTIHVFGGTDMNGECVRQGECIDLETRKREESVFIRKGNVADVVCAILRYGPDKSSYELQIHSNISHRDRDSNTDRDSKSTDNNSERNSDRSHSAGSVLQPKGWIMW
ncbi:influenza virus NS1A-binding protein homolog A-like [Lineus longissimus]|uniref:influenza virus NS1A-binding protein homolog A-like n=1 Tax=Lineus longissimus TaxID=88925 RepID=UPI002B4D8E70